MTRTGNKKATLVDNLDYYGISPTDVVHQVQRMAAASATGTYMYVPYSRIWLISTCTYNSKQKALMIDMHLYM